MRIQSLSLQLIWKKNPPLQGLDWENLDIEEDQEQILLIAYFGALSHEYKNLNRDHVPKQISPSDLAVKFINEL